MPEIAPIVGQPVAYGTGVLMLFVLGLSQFIGKYPLTLAHEGGHMLALVLFLRPITRWTLNDDTSGGTEHNRPTWNPFNLVITFAGYVAPPLLGLLGAVLIADDNSWGVLVLTLVLCLLAIVPARKWGLAFLIPALVVFGVGWALIDGTPAVRAAVAVGIAWYLLLGGVIDAFALPTDDGDARSLASRTGVVPGIVWKLLWIFIAVVCLLRGGSLLLAA